MVIFPARDVIKLAIRVLLSLVAVPCCLQGRPYEALPKFPEPLIFAPFASCTLGTYGAVVGLRRTASKVCSCVEYFDVSSTGLPVSGNQRQLCSAFQRTNGLILPGCATKRGELFPKTVCFNVRCCNIVTQTGFRRPHRTTTQPATMFGR